MRASAAVIRTEQALKRGSRHRPAMTGAGGSTPEDPVLKDILARHERRKKRIRRRAWMSHVGWTVLLVVPVLAAAWAVEAWFGRRWVPGFLLVAFALSLAVTVYAWARMELADRDQ